MFEIKGTASFNFDVRPFNGKNSIIEGLKNQKTVQVNQQSIHNPRFDYLVTYLDKIGVKTVIYEFDYVDKEYIEDYAHYYCRSFKDYQKKCVRLHFFTAEIQYNDFVEFLNTPDSNNKYFCFYAGFTVLRPIPLTLFGRTCLKTEEQTENYPATREYKIHLFGVEFKVKSIAFQEQDNAVSACATTALWVAFQITGRLFEHLIPTPYEITLNASKYMMPNNRKQIPYSEGLNPYQMAYAITQQGLQTLVTNPDGRLNYSKAEIYAYLKCGIPVILGVKENRNGHAVTAVGYDLSSKNLDLSSKSLLLKSSAISQIYVHDDQIGAFANMEFDTAENEDIYLKSSWWTKLNEDCKEKDMRFRISVLIFPLYHKIRIKFYKIHQVVTQFSSEALNQFPFKIMWDIYLTTVCDFKQEIRGYDNTVFDNGIKLKILTNNYPRYLWVAHARILNKDGQPNKLPDFSLYFDATDMENSDFFLFALHLNSDSYHLVRKTLKESSTKNNALISYEKKDYLYQMKRIIQQYIPELFNSEDTQLQNESTELKLPQIFYRKTESEKIIKELENSNSKELLHSFTEHYPYIIK